MEPTYTLREFANAVRHHTDITNSLLSAADIDHSSLLRRLLEGKPIYKKAPPRAFSYPWYELLDTGTAEFADISLWELQASADWKRGAKVDFKTDRLVMINQSVWGLESVISENEIIATYPHYTLRVHCIATDTFGDRKCWAVTVLETENETR